VTINRRGLSTSSYLPPPRLGGVGEQGRKLLLMRPFAGELVVSNFTVTTVAAIVRASVDRNC